MSRASGATSAAVRAMPATRSTAPSGTSGGRLEEGSAGASGPSGPSGAQLAPASGAHPTSATRVHAARVQRGDPEMTSEALIAVVEEQGDGKSSRAEPAGCARGQRGG